MNPNRKADLQRKLTMAPVPDPPAGLADRIKSEIPAGPELRFDLDKDRERMGDSVALIMRVAASVLVVVAMAYVVMQIASRTGEQSASRVFMEAKKSAAPSASTTQIADAKASDVSVESLPDRPPAVTRRSRGTLIETSAGVSAAPMSVKEEAVDAVVAQRQTTSDLARVEPAANAGIAAPAAAPPPPPVAVAESVTSVAPHAAAPEARAVEKAALPAAERRQARDNREADVSSLVARFANVAAPAPEMRVDVEATQSPFVSDRVLLRVSVDSGLPARDLRADVLLGEDVAQTQWLAGSWRWQSALFERQSTTAVAEMFVSTSADAPIALVRVTYRDANGEETIEKTIRRADIRTWSAASSRTKAAVLAAKSADPALRARAADLARDAGLTELAKALD